MAFIELGDAGFCELADIISVHREERPRSWWKGEKPCSLLLVSYKNDGTNEYEFLFSDRFERDAAYADLAYKLDVLLVGEGRRS